MTTKIDQLKQMRDEYTKAVKAAGIEAIREFFGPAFEANPTITGFRWTQYTPYFNDGGECTFSVHDLECRIAGIDEGVESDEDEGWLCSWDLDAREAYDNGRGYSTPARSARPERDGFRAVAKAFGAIPSDLLKEAFGDHAEVTVTRTEITVDEYSHD